MGDFRIWQNQVREWERDEIKTRDKYNTTHTANTYNLTDIKIRVCAKCGTMEGRIHRHHKGHEYLFARLLPSAYAARYIQFRAEDIVFLCDTNKCHLKIHKLYNPRLAELWPILNAQNGRITHEQAERFRLKLVRCCDKWLKSRKRKRVSRTKNRGKI